MVDADGSNLQQLTDNATEDRFPAWSPSGDRIAFETDRDGNYAIYVMDAAGTILRTARKLFTGEAHIPETVWRGASGQASI